MSKPLPDAALFAALVAARPRPAEPPAEGRAEGMAEGMAELVQRLADSIRRGNAFLREASAQLAEGDIAGLPELLAQAEAASLEQTACARGLLAALARPNGRRAA